ncbi:MAG TPA: hypothetical protein DCS93_03015 [Microscillaceae bacterium]|nr:hypothetical protein [Microscillaceae bacterium]
MAFEIIENKLLGKTGDLQLCEDQVVVTSHFAAVIDGASSKTSVTYREKSTGRFAADLLKNAIQRLPEEATFEQACDFLTYSLAKYYHKENTYDHLEKHPIERPAASVAIYSDYQQEVWLIGDCQCLVGKKSHSRQKRADQVIASVRALYLELLLQSDDFTVTSLQSYDLSRDYIIPLLKTQISYQNSTSNHPFRYSVVDGFPIINVNTAVIPLAQNTKPIVLATDGYPKLYTTLEKSESYLQKILEKDPLCYKDFQSTKGLYDGNISFDDRAYLKIQPK